MFASTWDYYKFLEGELKHDNWPQLERIHGYPISSDYQNVDEDVMA